MNGRKWFILGVIMLTSLGLALLSGVAGFWIMAVLNVVGLSTAVWAGIRKWA